jgi:hypothetical protein
VKRARAENGRAGEKKAKGGRVVHGGGCLRMACAISATGR